MLQGGWGNFCRSVARTLGRTCRKSEFQTGEDILDLPRIGLFLVVAPGFEGLGWLGLGPSENYPDRKACCWRAWHRSTVTEQFTPYTFLCLNASHRGVGTASCGPETLEKDRIHGHRFTLQLDLSVW